MQTKRSTQQMHGGGGNVIEIPNNVDVLSQYTSTGKLVFVVVSTSWCGPCKVFKPQYDALSQNYPDVIFLRTDGDKVQETKPNDINTKYNVQYYPTLINLTTGKIIPRETIEQEITNFQAANPPNEEKTEAPDATATDSEEKEGDASEPETSNPTTEDEPVEVLQESAKLTPGEYYVFFYHGGDEYNQEIAIQKTAYGLRILPGAYYYKRSIQINNKDLAAIKAWKPTTPSPSSSASGTETKDETPKKDNVPSPGPPETEPSDDTPEPTPQTASEGDSKPEEPSGESKPEEPSEKSKPEEPVSNETDTPKVPSTKTDTPAPKAPADFVAPYAYDPKLSDSVGSFMDAFYTYICNNSKELGSKTVNYVVKQVQNKSQINNVNYIYVTSTGDGACLYHSFSRMLYGDESQSFAIRDQIIDFVETQYNQLPPTIQAQIEDPKTYVSEMQTNKYKYGSETETSIFAILYGLKLITIRHMGPVNKTNDGTVDPSKLKIEFSQCIYPSAYEFPEGKNINFVLINSGDDHAAHYDLIKFEEGASPTIIPEPQTKTTSTPKHEDVTTPVTTPEPTTTLETNAPNASPTEPVTPLKAESSTTETKKQHKVRKGLTPIKNATISYYGNQYMLCTDDGCYPLHPVKYFDFSRIQESTPLYGENKNVIMIDEDGKEVIIGYFGN